MSAVAAEKRIVWKGLALFTAYREFPDPKPSLPVVLDLIKNEEIRGEMRGGLAFVPSGEEFAADLSTWIEMTDWSAGGGGGSHQVIPDGYVYLWSFIRKNVSVTEAVNAGLLTPSSTTSKPQLGSVASAEIRSGALPSAIKVGGRGIWAAPRGEVIDWLFSSFGLRTG